MWSKEPNDAVLLTHDFAYKMFKSRPTSIEDRVRKRSIVNSAGDPHKRILDKEVLDDGGEYTCCYEWNTDSPSSDWIIIIRTLRMIEEESQLIPQRVSAQLQRGIPSHSDTFSLIIDALDLTQLWAPPHGSIRLQNAEHCAEDPAHNQKDAPSKTWGFQTLCVVRSIRPKQLPQFESRWSEGGY